jgi:ATP-dependent DNA ligase
VIPQYTPMAPTLVREPFHRDAWVYEEKVDGWRILAYKSSDRVRLMSQMGATTRAASATSLWPSPSCPPAR